MTNMTYDESMQWIDSIDKNRIVLGLERIADLLEQMGHPEKDVQIIHVAGTNGKGSVCTMIASILKSAGYKVGRYISPTLYDYRERIQVNDAYIEKTEVSEGLSKLREIYEAMEERHMELPTVFELETALAFRYFKKQQCDYVVLETGMGGRLDSTNVIEAPVLSVITAIGMDHTRVLGDSLEAIAFEKAGILKNNIPAVVLQQQPEVMQVMETEAQKKHCAFHKTQPEALQMTEQQIFDHEHTLHGHQSFNYKQYKALQISLTGIYQVENATIAIEAIEALGLPFDKSRLETYIREGLLKAKWPGRFECLSRKPLIFVDGAHNVHGAAKLKQTLETYFKNKRIILVMGVFADKDYRHMLEVMAGVSNTLVCFTPDHVRGLNSSQLSKQAEGLFSHVIDADDAKSAVANAKNLAKDDDLIMIFGSLSTISTICDIIKYRFEIPEDMIRVQKILRHPEFCYAMDRIQALEAQRIFCGHEIGHLLDVARICYIENLEGGCGFQKDVVYAAGLLHDVGKYLQYTEGIGHHIAGKEIAERILKESGYTPEEVEVITQAILVHRSFRASQNTELGRLLYRADKISRPCYSCEAVAACNWSENKKIPGVIL